MTAPAQHFMVIGNPISHSKSPDIHHEFAHQMGLNIRYSRLLCPNDAASFQAVVAAFFAGGGIGANVTLPFKEIAYTLCDQLSDDARTAKAVNTLMIKDSTLFGDNTDGRGLVADLMAKGVSLSGAHVALLGAGGASRGVLAPLLQAGAKIDLYNRTFDKASALVNDFKQANHAVTARALDTLAGTYDLIINATSATTTARALALNDVSAHVAYDMMYGKPSPFLETFQAQGARCLDGFGMLIHQAALSFGLWTGIDSTELNLNVFAKL